MDIDPIELEKALDQNKGTSDSTGYGYLRSAAKVAVRLYGKDWVERYPISTAASLNRAQLRRKVISSVSKAHSNRDMVWVRFCKYAREA